MEDNDLYKVEPDEGRRLDLHPTVTKMNEFVVKKILRMLTRKSIQSYKSHSLTNIFVHKGVKNFYIESVTRSWTCNFGTTLQKNVYKDW